MKYPKKSEVKKGKNNPNFGKTISLEIRKKMSDSQKHRRYVVEGKEKFDKIKWDKERYSNMSIERKKERSWIKNKRNRMKRCATGSHTFGEWEMLKSQYNWVCPCCNVSEPKISLTEDHIVPISKGGSDNIENIQPLCKSCNCKKHTLIIKY